MQAARGASLSSDSARDTAHQPRRAAPYVSAFVALWVLALAVDQVTKHLAETRLAGEPSVRVVGDLLKLTLVFNPGAAFSTGTRFTVAISCLAVVASLLIGWYGVRARTPLWTAGLGLLMAGVTGNLIDRIFRDPGPMRGHVVDFLQLPHWPVFNVADICINLGAAVLVIQAVRGVRLDGRPEDGPEDRPGDRLERAEAPETAE